MTTRPDTGADDVVTTEVYIQTRTKDLHRGDRLLTTPGNWQYTQPADREEESVVRTVKHVKPHRFGAGNQVVTFTDDVRTVIGDHGKWYRLP